MKHYFRWIFLLVGLIASAAEPGAPAADSRGLRGTVQDTSGAVIAGAQVTVTTQDGKTAAHGSTDNSGSFHFADLQPGSYSVDVAKEGFRETRQAVKVGSTTRAPLRIVLPVAAVAENITVEGGDASAQISTEIGQNQSGNVADAAALDRLPMLDQDYITTMSRFLDPDASGTNDTTLVVNGVEANGPGVTASAIQSVKINQESVYCALLATGPRPHRDYHPGAAHLSFTVRGTSSTAIRSSTLQTLSLRPSRENRTYLEGSVTGPLSHSKKTTFLLALDTDYDHQQAIVNAAGPDGPINTSVPNPTDHYFLSGRVFHDYARGNQFWIGYSDSGEHGSRRHCAP